MLYQSNQKHTAMKGGRIVDTEGKEVVKISDRRGFFGCFWWLGVWDGAGWLISERVKVGEFNYFIIWRTNM